MNIYRYTFFALLAALTACSDNDFAGSTTTEGDGSIEFSVIPEGWKGIDDSEASRATVMLNSNFLAFRVAAVTEDKATHARSMLMKYQYVEKSGSNWTYTPIKYWPSPQQYTTSFYAYAGPFKRLETISGESPWEKAVVVIDDKPEEQRDFLVARYTANDKRTVQLRFEHALTAVKIKTVNVKRPILSIELTGMYNTGDFNFHTWKWENQRSSVWVGSTNVLKDFKYTFIGSELEGNSGSSGTYIKDGNNSEIYLMMIPQDLGATGRDAHLRVLFDNGTVVEQKLTQNWQKGQVVTYVIDYETNASCQWLDDSNSYLISPLAENNNTTKNIYAIPISTRINTFWENEGEPKGKPLVSGTEYVAEVIWQDSPTRQIYFTNKAGTASTDTYSGTVASDNEHVYFKLANTAFTGTANVVVGVRKSTESTYLWSWHLWITDYYPTPSTASKPSTASRIAVRNGNIERYEDPEGAPSAVWSGTNLNGRYLMDRNIGAKAAPKLGEGSYTEAEFNSTFGMYYQYGRKDPFPPNGTLYKINGSEHGTISESDATLITSVGLTSDGTSWPLVETVKYPLQFVTSISTQQYPLGGNWNNPTWWDLSKHNGKSFYDPCPPGWQIPPQGIFDIVYPNHTYTPGMFYTGTEATGNYEILKIGTDNVIGLRLGMNSNNSLKTDLLRWGVRWGDSGKWTTENKYTSFLWYNNYYMIFNYIYNFYDTETGLIVNEGQYLIDVNKKVQYGFHGAPIRAIHR